MRLVPVAAGVVAAAGSGLTRTGIEELAGPRLTVLVNCLLPTLTILAAALLIAGHGTAATLQGADLTTNVAAHAVTATLGWTALGILSAIVFGDAHAWILPALSVAAMTLFGYDQYTVPRSWNISAIDPEPVTILLALTVYLIAWGAWNALRYRRPLPLVHRQ